MSSGISGGRERVQNARDADREYTQHICCLDVQTTDES